MEVLSASRHSAQSLHPSQRTRLTKVESCCRSTTMTATQTCALSGRWTFGQKYTLPRAYSDTRIPAEALKRPLEEIQIKTASQRLPQIWANGQGAKQKYNLSATLLLTPPSHGGCSVVGSMSKLRAKKRSAANLPMPYRCMWQRSCIKLDAKLQSICKKSIACQVFLA